MEYAEIHTDFKVYTPVYYAVFNRIVPGANKYMATLFNTDPNVIIMVDRIYRLNWRATDVSDTNLEQYLARITARTAGTEVTIHADDVSDMIPFRVTADTNSTGVTETNIRTRFFATNDSPVGLTGGDKHGAALFHSFNLQDGIIYQRLSYMKGIVLRQNQGLTIRNVTSNTVGDVSYIMEFSQVY